MEEKFQLIDQLITVLGDENTGVQVRGYRNANIIRQAVESLVALKRGLAQEDDEHKKELEDLRNKLKEAGAA